ncbi:MAG: tRNA-modifying protein YgfZ, partial [Thermoleophilia bacterium]|nr:tRNA-modifying protein YgfZ [Thermoleophilia bacterium]
ITAGVPALSDLLLDHMPAEVGGVDLAVSLTKGCYLGQEPVARLHWRGKANRVLHQVELDSEIADDLDIEELSLIVVAAGQAASPEAKVVGVVTSWARQPDGTHVGLAVARRELDTLSLLKIAGTDVSVRIVEH